MVLWDRLLKNKNINFQFLFLDVLLTSFTMTTRRQFWTRAQILILIRPRRLTLMHPKRIQLS